MPKRSRTPDLNTLAARLVAQATGAESAHAAAPPADGKNPAAVALGRLGGLKGGRARAMKLTEKQRSEIARIAAAARWKKDGR